MVKNMVHKSVKNCAFNCAKVCKVLSCALCGINSIRYSGRAGCGCQSVCGQVWKVSPAPNHKHLTLHMSTHTHCSWPYARTNVTVLSQKYLTLHSAHVQTHCFWPYINAHVSQFWGKNTPVCVTCFKDSVHLLCRKSNKDTQIITIT